MKKFIITFFTLCLFVIFTFTDIAIASDIVDVGFSVPFQLFTYNGEIILWNGYDENGYDKQIVFEKKPYIKDSAIMLPLKEVLQANEQYSEIIKSSDGKTVTFTLNDKKAVFFEGKRNTIVDGIERGLYVVPDIAENDIFISADDLFIIFNMRGTVIERTRNKNKRTINGQSCDTLEYAAWGPHLAEKNRLILGEKLEIVLKSDKFKQEIHNYYIDTKEVYDTMKDSEWYETSKSFPPYRQKKEYLLTNKICNTYEKDGEIMIAAADMKKLTVPNTLWDIKWNGEQNTAIIKTYNTTPNDVVITKDSNIMNLNNKNIEMATAAEIKDNRLYIPVKAMFEILDVPEQNVKWIAETEVIFTY